MQQYNHDYVLSIFSKDKELLSHQLHGSFDTIKRAEIWDKDYIGMTNESSICYDLGTILVQEKKSLEICIIIQDNKNISELEEEVERIKKKDLEKEYTGAKSYWRKYVKAHNGLNIKEPENSYEERE